LEALEDRVLLSFGPPVSYNVGTQPSPAANNVSADGVATGDFNGDGKLDLAVVHTIDRTLNVLLNNGDGTFRPAVSYPATGMGVGPVWLTVADFNGDGILDVAVLGNRDSSSLEGVIDVFMGNGDGTFRPAVSYDSGPISRGGIAVGDFNGDGKLDMAVADFGPFDATHSAVDVLLNNGDGTFRAPYAVPVPPAARSVVAGDFNGDGKTDLAVCDGFGTNGVLDSTYPAGMTILLGNGDGTFTTAGQYVSPATPGGGTVNPEIITAGDLRNNGITDVIVSDYDHNINVFLGNGDGTFQPAVGYDTGEYGRAVAIADVNGDGKLDLVVNNVGIVTANPPEAGSVAVLLGNGDGTFQAPIQYTPFNYPGGLAVGDFNGDGLPDVAVTRVQDGHSVNVMLNQGETLTVAGYPLAVTAGDPNTFTVILRAPEGNIDPTYRGTVHFTSTDPQAILPRDYTFTAADAGAHTFGAVFRTAGTQTLIVTDTVTAALSGTEDGIAVNPAAVANALIVAGLPSPTQAGEVNTFTVTAVDAFGNVVSGYQGTLHFTSSDTAAYLPRGYTFTDADAGSHTFAAVLFTPGTQTLTAQDTVFLNLASQLQVDVVA
jgi:hypothetical protein